MGKILKIDLQFTVHPEFAVEIAGGLPDSHCLCTV